MVQFFQTSTPREKLAREDLARSLGTGLSDFMGNYLAQKSVTQTESSNEYKDAPMSQKMSMLANTLRPYGERGQKMFQQEMAIAQQGQLEKLFDKAKGMANDPNTSLMDIYGTLMQAGAGIPGSERYMGQLLPLLTQQWQATQSQKAAQERIGTGMSQQNQPTYTEQVPKMQKQAPGFLGTQPQGPEGQAQRIFPTNLGPQSTRSNAPAPATEGIELPIRSPQEREMAAIKRSQNSGGVISVEQAREMENKYDDSVRQYNADIKAERDERTIAQGKYGAIAKEAMDRYMPDATGEQLGYLAQKAETYSKNGDSDAEIKKAIDKDAIEFKKMISDLQNGPKAIRVQNALKKFITGETLDREKAKQDVRIKMRPLLDAGLVDTARNILISHNEYGRQEADEILFDLPKEAESIVNELPKPYRSLGPIPTYISSVKPDEVAGNLQKVFSVDPNANLLLLRQAYEDKGVNWRTYKDAVNSLFQKNPTAFSQDQYDQMTFLDTAPMSNLGQYLKGFIGK